MSRTVTSAFPKSDVRPLAQTQEVKASTALPVDRGGDTARLTFDYLPQTCSRNARRVLADLDANESAIHLQGNGSCSAGTKVRVQHQVAKIAANVKNSCQQRLWFRRVEEGFSGEKGMNMLLR